MRSEDTPRLRPHRGDCSGGARPERRAAFEWLSLVVRGCLFREGDASNASNSDKRIVGAARASLALIAVGCVSLPQIRQTCTFYVNHAAVGRTSVLRTVATLALPLEVRVAVLVD